MDLNQFEKSTHKNEVESLYKTAEALRKDSREPRDISLQEVFYQKHNEEQLKKDNGYTDDQVDRFFAARLMEDLGIDPQYDTIENVLTLPHDGVKWVVPEIMRSAIRLGMRRAPIYPNIIRGEEPVSALQVQIPYINMSDASARYVNEGETITFGDISYGSKEFRIRKMGRGIEWTDEMRLYSTLNVANIFFEDFGVKLGYGLDGAAVDILLNGEQANGSQSAPVIGVDTVGTFSYRDLLRVWVRLTRMGKNPTTMVGGELAALSILDLDEFKKKEQGTTRASLNIRTPIPNSSEFFIHGSIPDTQVVILDPATTMMKFNARPLMIESERIVSNQTNASYASLTTGFAILFRDSRLILDSTLDESTNGFPTYMNPDALAIDTIK